VTGIHRAAAQGFARSADAYERGRPEYPQAAVDHLAGLLGVGATVLDLAAGTGKLTRPLLAAGLDVIAVEPVAEMRAVLPTESRAGEGTAEAIPLPDGAVDGVTVGQAFHWFDGDAALAEIARVLRPGGLLALVWNRRVDDDPVNAAIEEIVAPYRGETPSHRGGAWRAAFERSDGFSPLEETVFEHPIEQDSDGLAARVGSISFIAALAPAERVRVVERARAIAGAGGVTIPYRTEVHACRRVLA
jgi:ubiquinone/menaquinone biosynthesis C-methylase UbiE